MVFGQGIVIPSTNDEGKGYVLSTPRPAGTYTYFTGRFDSPTAVGNGSKMVLLPSGASSVTLKGTFNESVFMNGMFLNWKNCDSETEVTYEIYAPATQLAAGPGPYNLFSGMIVPAAGPTAGSYQIPTGKQVPIPVADWNVPNGFFDIVVNGTKIVSKTEEKLVTKAGAQIVTNGNPTGFFNLYAVGIKLNRFGNLIGLEGNGSDKYIAYDSEPVLPYWEHWITMKNPSQLPNPSIKVTSLMFRRTTL